MRLGGASEAMMSVAQMALIANGRDPSQGMDLGAIARGLFKEIKRMIRPRR